MKRVLVTGACGFIGSHTLPILQELGYEVFAVHRTHTEFPQGVRGIVCDLLNEKDVCEVMARIHPSHLLHFAWVTEHGKFWEDPRNLSWVRGSIFLFQEFAKHGGKRAAIAGTCAEYTWDQDIYSENAPCNPDSLYGKSKNCLRILLEPYARQQEISLAWGRIFFTYGPNEPLQKLISSMITHFLQEKPFLLQNGCIVRDFLHAHDIAEAFVRLLDSDIQGPINIGSGEGVSLEHVGNLIQQILGKTELLHPAATPEAPPSHIVADVNHLKHSLKWEPSFSIEEGLHHTLQLLKNTC